MPKEIHKFIVLKIPEAPRLCGLQTVGALKTVDPRMSHATAIQRTLGS